MNGGNETRNKDNNAEPGEGFYQSLRYFYLQANGTMLTGTVMVRRLNDKNSRESDGQDQKSH
jgi:hypothetical protein